MDTLNKHWKNDKTGFGFRMLSKMGWKEDKGLGKNGSGITNNIKISKRDIGLGLGMDGNDESVKLGSQVASFNDVLQVLKHEYSGDGSNTIKNRNKDKKKSRIEKDEKTSKVKSSSTIVSFGVGMKYKKFSKSKDMSSKSQEDLTAIFGSSENISKPTSSSSSSSSAAATTHHEYDFRDTTLQNIHMHEPESITTSSKSKKIKKNDDNDNDQNNEDHEEKQLKKAKKRAKKSEV